MIVEEWEGGEWLPPRGEAAKDLLDAVGIGAEPPAGRDVWGVEVEGPDRGATEEEEEVTLFELGTRRGVLLATMKSTKAWQATFIT